MLAVRDAEGRLVVNPSWHNEAGPGAVLHHVSPRKLSARQIDEARCGQRCGQPLPVPGLRTYRGWAPLATRTRMRAKRLLRGTGLPLERIAQRCGCTSSGALSTAFLRHTGARPSAYRNS